MAGWDESSLDALDAQLTKNAGSSTAPTAPKQSGPVDGPAEATPKKKKKKVTRRMSMMSQ